MYFGQHHDLLQQLWAMHLMHPCMLPTGLQDVKDTRNILIFCIFPETSSRGRNQDYVVEDHFLMYLLPLLPGLVIPPHLHSTWDITFNPVPHLGTIWMMFRAHSKALSVLQDLQALQVCLETFQDFLVALRVETQVILGNTPKTESKTTLYCSDK